MFNKLNLEMMKKKIELKDKVGMSGATVIKVNQKTVIVKFKKYRVGRSLKNNAEVRINIDDLYWKNNYGVWDIYPGAKTKIIN